MPVIVHVRPDGSDAELVKWTMSEAPAIGDLVEVDSARFQVIGRMWRQTKLSTHVTLDVQKVP